MSSYPNYISIIKCILGLGALVAFFASGLAYAVLQFSCRSGGVPHRHPDRSCGHEHRQSLLGIAWLKSFSISVERNHHAEFHPRDRVHQSEGRRR